MSGDTLTVHVNRGELHALEVPDTFEATGAFDLQLVNHGESIHVHLHLDDALSEVASIDASNHFVDGHSERLVRVHVDGGASTFGRLKVASAYGAQTRYVDVELVEPEEEKEPVQVDESLSRPAPRSSEPEGSALGTLADNPEVVVLALGVVALAVALVAAFVFNSTVVLLGALVVLGAVLAAIYVLVTS